VQTRGHRFCSIKPTINALVIHEHVYKFLRLQLLSSLRMEVDTLFNLIEKKLYSFMMLENFTYKIIQKKIRGLKILAHT
jgi:hypothetical protein